MCFAREAAECVSQVLREVFQELEAPSVANFFLESLDATERDQRLAPGFFPAHPPAQVRLGLHLEVHAELLSEVLRFTRTEEEGSKPFASLGEETHARTRTGW